MESRREDAGRLPQFTESHYEIPSWQTPWNKPWYQRIGSSNSAGDKQKTYKYNSRGHLTDCSCSLCEEDLEKAFSPQSNQKTLFDIPKDRRDEIKIQQFEEVGDDDGKDPTSSSKNKPQNSNGLDFASSGNSDAPKKIYMFSDLAEVSQNTTSDASNSGARSSSASLNSQERRETTFEMSSNNAAASSMTHESVMDGFGKLTSIQAISDKSQDIQERVRNYRGKSDTQEYKIMKGLLESLLAELNRINSSVEWVATSRAIAKQAIQNTLHTLEQKVKDADS